MDWRREFRRQSRRDHRTPGHRVADQDDRFVCPRFHARLPSSFSRSAPLLAYHRRTKTAIILRPGEFSLLATGNGHPRLEPDLSKDLGTAIAKYAIISHIIHMWIVRDIEPRLDRSARTRPVVLVTGARETGKPATFVSLFPNHGFVPAR